MLIHDYIIYDAHNYNKIFASTFDDKEMIREYVPFGSYNELKCFIEVPVDDSRRLFIRTFSTKENGRQESYYAGFIITKDMYSEAREYYMLVNGLLDISLSKMLEFARKREPIPFSPKGPMPSSSVWTPFEELSSMKFFGESEFDENFVKACLSVSVNNIQDWFTRLKFAVNPGKWDHEYDVLVSRNNLGIELPQPPPSTPPGKDLFLRISICFSIVLLAALICYVFSYSKLKEQNTSLKFEITKLKEQNTSLKSEITKLKEKRNLMVIPSRFIKDNPAVPNKQK